MRIIAKKQLIDHLLRYHIQIDIDSLPIAAFNSVFNRIIAPQEFITLAHIVNNDNLVTCEDFYKDKQIIVLDEENVHVLKEDPRQWVVELRVESSEDIHGNVGDFQKVKQVEYDPWRKASLALFTKLKSFAYATVKEIYVEKNEVPVLEINAGSNKLRLLFGSDTFRERFQIELFRKMGTKFQKKVVTYAAV